MTLDQNDWRLTAYALDELDDVDRAEVEAAIAASPELAGTVAEIRATVGLLQTALATGDVEAPAMVGSEVAFAQSPGREPGEIGGQLVKAMASIEGEFADPSRAVQAGSVPGLAPGALTFGKEAMAGRKRSHPIRRVFVPLAAAASIAIAVGAAWFTFAPGLSRSREVVSVSKVDRLRAHAPGTSPSPLQTLGYVANGDKTTNPEKGEVPMDGAEVSASRFYGFDESANARPPAPSSTSDTLPHQYLLFGDDQHLRMGSVAYALNHKSLATPSTARAREVTEYIRKHTEAPGAPQLVSAGGHSGDFQVVSVHFRDETGAFIIEGPQRVFENIDELLEELQPESPGFEDYRAIQENPFRLVESDPLSTFSIDVDTASYANVRRWITSGRMPPPDAVRIEEMINYFDYAYPQPVDEHPFAVHVEVAQCPWNGAHRLARIGIKGYEIAPQDRPPANLVFLIDVSGSMQPPNKLPLLREALGLMVDELHRDDTVGIVVYAGASGIVLSPTNNKDVIRSSLSGLMAGGGTNGAAGIEAAYQLAQDTFVPGGINRVILATDGDFNVGVTSGGDLQRLIEEKAKSGVFLTVLGFGMGNYKDGTLETLADKGNGNYAYIDTLSEAEKVLIEQMEGTLVTIAKDVKIQVEFNPLMASAYRLIGYENRMLAAQDFNDDKKDAGEIGAGHTVTALYEIVPAGVDVDVPPVDTLKYQTVTEFTPAAESGEMMTVKLRYKEPDGEESKLIEVPVADGGAAFADSSDDFAFAASVAAFGLLLRNSECVGSMDYTAVAEFAEGAKGQDVYGYRAEFIELVRKAAALP